MKNQWKSQLQMEQSFLNLKVDNLTNIFRKCPMDLTFSEISMGTEQKQTLQKLPRKYQITIDFSVRNLKEKKQFLKSVKLRPTSHRLFYY